MRYLGLDVHRDFCEVAICERGRARSAGRIDTTREALELFASSVAPDDRVVLESTGNALAIANILRRHVAAVVLANPMQVRAITHAKVKNDRVDARTWPSCWPPTCSPKSGSPTNRRGRYGDSRRAAPSSSGNGRGPRTKCRPS
jgi:transposase